MTGQAEYDFALFGPAAKPLEAGSPKLLHARKLLRARRGQDVLPDGRGVWETAGDEVDQVVALVISNATETEGRFWSISDYPGTDYGRFATLNAGNLDLLWFPREHFEPEERFARGKRRTCVDAERRHRDFH